MREILKTEDDRCFIIGDNDEVIKYKNVKTAVFIHLHYFDKVDEYFEYIKQIPSEIPIYISVSVDATIDRIKFNINLLNIKNITIIKKENRGRDLSALLVSFRKIILKYDIVCFVHDKKEKESYLKEDFDNWNKNLWGNTLYSENYIYCIIDILTKNKNIGVLLPPDPIGRYNITSPENSWMGNFYIARELAIKIGIKKDLDISFQKLSYGTVFWAKTEALKKLFDYDWKYIDFPPEPLPVDGTISHALERMFPYIALDSGFDTAIVMNASYAKWYMTFMRDALEKSMDIAKKYLYIRCIADLDDYNEQIDKISAFCKEHKDIYIYGAGKIGRECLKILKFISCEPRGFIVTENKESNNVMDKPVYNLSEISDSDHIGIIIAVSSYSANYNEVEAILKKHDRNYIAFQVPFK